jgi:hypothetical protein
MYVYQPESYFFYSTIDYSQYITILETNLSIDAIALIDIYEATGFTPIGSVVKLVGSSSIKFSKADVFNAPAKFVARLFGAEGIWWADNFILQDGVVNIDFKSQGEAGGSGELKTFSGSLTQDGQPVSRAIYALAIGGDVPRLLASAVSDAAGNYSLQWNGYTGQILVTATDDYGAPFTAEALLSIGASVHPATPNGYIYEAASAGPLGLEEPAWPAIEGESVTSGQVQLVTKPFYRPKSAGPFTIV